MATLSINGNANESNLVVDNIAWDKAAINYDSAQKIGIKIPVSKNNVTGEKISLATMSVNGITNGCFVKLIPDSTWYANNKGVKNYQNLNGTLKIYDIQGVFLTKVKIINSAVVDNKSLDNSNKNNIGNITTLGKELAEVTVTSFKHNVYIFINLHGSENSVSQGIVYDMQPDETSGSAPDETPKNIATIDDIKDSLQNECLKKAWDSLYNKGMSDSIVSFLNDNFLGTSKFNIVITEVANLTNSRGDSLDGHTKTVFNPNTGVLDITLQLNSSTLPDATLEFTTATILHEILHAYLRATGVVGRLEQENRIASNYVSTIYNSLKKNFPNFPDDKAWAIAWGGLDGTLTWNNNLTQAEKDSFLIENNRQHAGENGTKCK